jgi:class 3 adenylate cyclase
LHLALQKQMPFSEDQTKVDSFILFLDIKGFSHLDNSQQNLLLEHLYKETNEIISKHKGSILDTKTIGDSFIIYFSEQNPCLKCADLICSLFLENYFWKKNGLNKLECRIALHRGELQFIRDAIEERHALFGKSITTVARLEPVVRENEVWCTPQFFQALSESPENKKFLKEFPFENIGKCVLAKNYGVTEVYALHMKGKPKPKRIIPEYDRSRRLFPDSEFPYDYFIFVRLRNKTLGIESLESVFNPPDYHIDALYYIYGDFDVLIRIRSKKEIEKKELEDKLRHKKRKIIKKGHDNILIFSIKGLADFSTDKFQILDKENEGEYNFNRLNKTSKYFKSFIYLKSTEIKAGNDLAKFIKRISSAANANKDLLNIYINDSSLIVETILEARDYYELSKLVEAIEDFCDENNWDIARSITFPVHDLDEKIIHK